MKVKVSIFLWVLMFVFSTNINAVENESLRVGISCEATSVSLQSICNMTVFDSEENYISSNTTIAIGNENYNISDLKVESNEVLLSTEYDFDSNSGKLIFTEDVNDEDVQIQFVVNLDEIKSNNIYTSGTEYNNSKDEYSSAANYYYDLNFDNTYSKEDDVKASFVGLPINFDENEIIVDLHMTSNDAKIKYEAEEDAIKIDDNGDFVIELIVTNEGNIPVTIADLGLQNFNYNDGITFNNNDGELLLLYNNQEYEEYLKNNEDLLYKDDFIVLELSGIYNNNDNDILTPLTLEFDTATTVLNQDNAEVYTEFNEITFYDSEDENILDTGLNNNLYIIFFIIVAVLFLSFKVSQRGRL